MKGKSCHDLLDDTSLSSVPAVDAGDTDDDDERNYTVNVRTTNAKQPKRLIENIVSRFNGLELTTHSWLGGSVAERRSLIGKLSLVCTGPAADG